MGPKTDFYPSVNKKDFEKLRMDSSAKNRAFIDKFVGRLSITKSFFNFFCVLEFFHAKVSLLSFLPFSIFGITKKFCSRRKTQTVIPHCANFLK